MGRKAFVGGNWKMNGNRASVKTLVEALNNGVDASSCDVVVCPPFLYAGWVKENIKPEIAVGVQNCYLKTSGAFTGEVAAEMIQDAGIPYVILGHSERRDLFGETNEMVGSKVAHALQTGLSVIVCIGEHLDEHNSGKTAEVLAEQLAAIAPQVSDWSRVVLAYEPVFCIGTGISMSPEEAQATHVILRGWLMANVNPEVAGSLRILYGGSVSAASAPLLAQQPDIDGFLVGGASLKGPDFSAIVAAAASRK